MNALDHARDLLADDLEAVEQLLAQAVASRAGTIRRASDHLLASGGKRVRAILCLLAAKACRFDTGHARRIACCSELAHAASLCHDDVLDRGELRRGRPTVRALFGDPMSILLGDYCLAQAFRLLAEAGLIRASAGLAAAVIEMAEGEVIQARRLGAPGADVEAYFAVAEAKTGALLTWCTSLGGLAPEAHLHTLVGFGRSLGRVYQIADDLLDFESTECSGKALGQDLSAGENTLPLLLACAARPDLGDRIRALREPARTEPEQIATLLAEIEATGAVHEARSLASDEAERAARSLEGLPDTPYRAALAGLAHFAAERHV